MWIALVTSFLINAEENKQLRVAVIDGGFSETISSLVKLCEPVKVIKTETQSHFFIGHGTSVVGLIDYYKGNKTNVCYILIAHMGVIDNFSESINYANERNADVINISASGDGSDKQEYEALKNFLFKDKKRRVFVASGNKRKNLNQNCDVYPACYKLKRIQVISNNKDYANRLSKAILSDKDGSEFKVFGLFEIGGTSGSTAIETGRYLNGTN